MKKRLCALLCAALLLCAGCAAAEESWFEGEMARRGAHEERRKNVAAITIYGSIDVSDYEYDHYGTLDAIDALIDDEDNLGLILLLDTPGGSVYEMDELYHQIMVYREETHRPVFAYMERECCSAGVYVAMAAQTVYASRMTLTGSVGVYMEESSDAELLQKLGVRREFVATGENKLTAPEGMTDEQRAILQGIVDENFEAFKGAIALARGEDVAGDEELLDGRLLTAAQAQDKGLIDGICYYDEAIDAFYDEGRFGEAELVDVTPEWQDGWDGDAQEEDSPLDEDALRDLYRWLRTLEEDAA